MSIADLKNILTPPNMPKETSDEKKWPVIDEGVFFLRIILILLMRMAQGGLLTLLVYLIPSPKTQI